ncbi:hypothetical protein DEJ30_08435 [Curtobacterium sp. MCPF17_003]|nr:hypothetical protein DEJ30_08435 [Curtobacterium sp. MCPF17_003]
MAAERDPKTARTFWSVGLVLASVIGVAAVIVLVTSPAMTGMYFTVAGMICLILVCAGNLRRLR